MCVCVCVLNIPLASNGRDSEILPKYYVEKVVVERKQ